MSTMIEDSPRPNLTKWMNEATATGVSSGVVLNPWATPSTHIVGPGKKPGIIKQSDDLSAAGTKVWFNPLTEVLQMSGVGDFRYYDQYDLWGGVRGDLSTPALQQAHVEKVFAVQDSINATRLSPTVLLHAGLGPSSVTALDLAREAVSQDPNAWLAISGTDPFWAGGRDLDSHIGALAQFQPSGWFISVARPSNILPAPTSDEAIHGLCRTVRALSEGGVPIHVSHGDLAALPAVAAGASTVGTGWDRRQRALCYSDYAPRDSSGGGGGWFTRPTLRGLLGWIEDKEAQVLNARHAAFIAGAGGLPAPGPKEAFLHHTGVLAGVVADIQAQGSYRARCIHLANLYDRAEVEWAQCATRHPTNTSAVEWIRPFATGLRLYKSTEGW